MFLSIFKKNWHCKFNTLCQKIVSHLFRVYIGMLHWIFAKIIEVDGRQFTGKCFFPLIFFLDSFNYVFLVRILDHVVLQSSVCEVYLLDSLHFKKSIS